MVKMIQPVYCDDDVIFNRYENHPDHKAAYHIVIKNVRRQRVHPIIFEYMSI